MGVRMCKGYYDCYPQNCEMCSRFMDDCDGSGLDYEDEDGDEIDYLDQPKDT